MSMATATEKYRRLPGRRRSLWNGASMWLGSDHILLVRSAWYREEYKRFYLRDIQAIVVAPCARFPVSTPMLVFALLWLLPGLGMAFWPVGIRIVWSLATLTMAATWVSISIASSCRCRLYTAVSKDDLPSLYRTWTARRFLNQVRPWIDRVQGVVDPGWVETERSIAGPAAAPLTSVEALPRAPARSHTLAADLFVVSLLIGALVDFSTVHSTAAVWFRVNTGLTLLQLAGAVTVLIQHRRGQLRRALQKVSIAALVLIGVMFYVQAFTFSAYNADSTFIVNGATFSMPSPAILVHQVDDGVSLLLGFIGAALILRTSTRNEPDIIET